MCDHFLSLSCLCHVFFIKTIFLYMYKNILIAIPVPNYISLYTVYMYDVHLYICTQYMNVHCRYIVPYMCANSYQSRLLSSYGYL